MSLSIMPLLIMFASQLQPTPTTIRGRFGGLTKTRAAQPTAKPAPKPASKEKGEQLFKTKRKVGKGFYSTPVDGQ